MVADTETAVRRGAAIALVNEEDVNGEANEELSEEMYRRRLDRQYCKDAQSCARLLGGVSLYNF